MKRRLQTGASVLLFAVAGCAEPVVQSTAPEIPERAGLALTPVTATNIEVVSSTGVRMVDLGINGPAYDINNDGVVVGSIISGQGWRWANGTAVSIGARVIGAQSDARSINNQGDVAGWASNNIDRVAVSLPAGSETLQRVGAIASPNTFPRESASEILDNGAVVGYGLGSGGLNAGFLGNIALQTGQELARLGGGPCLVHGADLAQNSRVAIVGQCTTSRVEATAWFDGNGDGIPEARALTSLPGVSIAYDIHGFEAAGVIDGKPYIMPMSTVAGPPLQSLRLPTLIPDGNGAAEDINDLFIVGNNVASDGQQHAVIWTSRDAIPTDLGTLPGDVKSYAYAVNQFGVVAGYSMNATGRYRAVVWYPGTVADNSAPSASISAPSGGTALLSGENITFLGEGTDAEDGLLGGSSLAWSSSIDGALGTGTSVTTAALSIGTHTITLQATDSEGATGDASILVTVTSPPNSAPRVSIVSPTDGAEFLQGTPITFTASATDAEDGVLSGDAIVWRSSLDGALGSGSSLTTSTLRTGEHVVEVTTTDADGATATAAIRVHIAAPSGLAESLAALVARLTTLLADDRLGPEGTAIVQTVRNAEQFVSAGNLNGARGMMKALVRGLLPSSLRQSPLSAVEQEAVMQAANSLLRELGG